MGPAASHHPFDLETLSATDRVIVPAQPSPSPTEHIGRSSMTDTPESPKEESTAMTEQQQPTDGETATATTDNAVFSSIWDSTSAFSQRQQQHQSLLQSLLLRHSTTSLNKYMELPTIAVMGDTSSGKSSLLSSLSGLDLPSAATLTTKCPIVLQLIQKADAPLQATIQIHWQQQQQQPASSSSSSSPRDRKRELEHQFESVTLQHDDVVSQQLSHAIQKAQDCILNYRHPSRIAPDRIHVTVIGTSMPTLTLVDLPGLVQYDAEEDATAEQQSSLQDQVQQVMQEYCTNTNCLVLAVLPAPVDIHNSTVLQWMKQDHIDPTGLRTIPVFTKPDLMDPGSEQSVLDLLIPNNNNNNTHPWFLVKNRGQTATKEGTIEDGWKDETQYFAENTAIWNAIPPTQLGVPNLRKYLMQVQWNRTMDVLPSIQIDLKRQKETCESQLETLGTFYQTPLERRNCFQEIIQDFCHSLEGSLSGKQQRRRRFSSTDLAATQLHEACDEFRSTVRSGALATITTLTEGTHVWVKSPINPACDIRGEIVHIHQERKVRRRGGDDPDDDELSYACVDFLDPRDHSTDVLFDGIGFKNPPPPPPAYLENSNELGQEAYQVDDVWTDGIKVFIARNYNRYDSLRKIPLSRIRTDPSWLMEKIQAHRTDDLACFLNVDQFRQIVAEFVHDDWKPACEDLVDKLQSILTSTIEDSWDAVLPLNVDSEETDETIQDSSSSLALKYPKLRSMLVEKCHEATTEILTKARGELHDHMEMEQNHPYTQDDTLVQEIAKARHSALRKDLEWNLKLHQEGVAYDRQAILTILDRVFDKHADDDATGNIAMYMAEELECILSSYGKMATQRVLDRSPMICWQVCRTLKRKLQSTLLGCATDESLERDYFHDSPDAIEKYQETKEQLDEVSKAMGIVSSILQS